jgi:tetratricopeptide (TPR) repeat protein
MNTFKIQVSKAFLKNSNVMDGSRFPSVGVHSGSVINPLPSHQVSSVPHFQGKPSTLNGDKPKVSTPLSLTFIESLPSERSQFYETITLPLKVLARTAKRAMKRGFSSAYQVAKDPMRESQMELAKGHLNQALKLQLQWFMAEEKEPLLLNECAFPSVEFRRAHHLQHLCEVFLKMAEDQKRAKSLPENAIEFENGGIITEPMVLLDPPPITTQTGAYYKSLKATELDFQKMAQSVYEEAIPLLKETASQASQPIYAWSNIAALYRRFENLPEAIAAMQQATQVLTPQDTFGWRVPEDLAKYHIEAGQLSEAVAVYKKLSLDNPKIDRIQAAYAVLLVVDKQLDAGLLQIKSALKLRPNGKLSAFTFTHAPEDLKTQLEHYNGVLYSDLLGRILMMREGYSIPPEEAK